MPRIKSSPRKCIKSKSGQSKSWVLIAEDDVMKPTDEVSPDIKKLRHPRSGLPAMFLFSADNSTVQEILAFQEKKGSWFMNDTVQEDGKMHISTPIDPVFLVLPYLKKCKQEGKVMPLEDLLVDPEFPETVRLVKSSGLKYISSVADRKGNEELNAWMYNEEKTLRWLHSKAENVAAALKERGFNVGNSAVSQSYVKSGSDKDIDTTSYLTYAFGLLSEYLPDDIATALRQHLNIPEEEVRKRKASSDPVNLKRSKVEEEETKSTAERSQTKKAAKTATVKEKSQAKAAASSKSITSFFKKK